MRSFITIVIVAMSLAACTTVAEAKRLNVAVVGDSVQESLSINGDFFAGVVPVLRDELRSRGSDAGGRGFVAPKPPAMAWSGAWHHAGWGFGETGPFGANGYAAETTDPGAAVTVNATDRRVGVTFWRGPEAGRFSVTAGDRRWEIDARAPSEDGRGIAWLDLPAKAEKLAVHGPSEGILRFTGVLFRRDATGGRDVVEVSDLSHAGRRVGEDQTERNREAFTTLGFDVTLIMAGTVDQLTYDMTGEQRFPDEFDGGLRARARSARAGGGRCVIIPPPALPVKPATRERYREIAGRVAAEEGCRFEPVLDRLWVSSAASRQRGLTTDGFHLTRRGYRAVTQRLAGLLAP